MTTPLQVSIDHLASTDSEHICSLLESAIPTTAPAAVLSVWRDGEPALEVAAGWLDPASMTRATPPDAVFDLASVSKIFTTTAFLALVSDGAVELDDAVVSVIPEFGAAPPRPIDGGQEPLSRRLLPAPPERAGWSVDPAEVTFRQLLTHSSGMAPWRSVFRESGPAPPPPDQLDPVSAGERRRVGLGAIFGYGYVARPGGGVHYSDLGFMTLGEAVSRIAGAPLEAVIGERISIPLELDTVGYSPLRAGIARERIAPTSTDTDWRMRRCWGEVEDENAAGLGGVAGHAGLFATAADVARLGQAWLDADARLGLGPTVARLAVSDQTPSMGEARGLGWQIRGTHASHLSPLGEGAYGHTGFTGTSLAVDPSRGQVVALLTNRVYTGRTHEGIEELRHDINSALVGDA